MKLKLEWVKVSFNITFETIIIFVVLIFYLSLKRATDVMFSGLHVVVCGYGEASYFLSFFLYYLYFYNIY